MTRLCLFRLKPQDIDWVSESESSGIDLSGKNFVSWYRTLMQERHDVAARVQEDLRPVLSELRKAVEAWEPPRAEEPTQVPSLAAARDELERLPS